MERDWYSLDIHVMFFFLGMSEVRACVGGLRWVIVVDI